MDMDMLLTREWLDDRLNKIEDYESILLFKEEVENFVRNKSFVSKWHIDEFFIIVWSTFLAEDLSNMKNIQPGIGVYKGQLLVYSPSYFEIQETVNTFQSSFDETFHTLTQLKNTQGVEEIDLPIIFLELIESSDKDFYLSLRMTRHYKVINSSPKKIRPLSPEDYTPPRMMEELSPSPERFLVVPWLAELIRFQHYGLEPTVAKNGIFPVQRLTIDEAAKYLEISVNQFIEKCFEEETLGVYLKNGQFKVKQFITTSSKCLTRSYIGEISTPSYPYKYKGLVRLVKSSELDPDNTLEQIYNGSIIEVSTGAAFALVPLQSSIAEYAQGISQVIELRKGQKIAISDLIFVQSELQEFKNNTNHEELSFVAVPPEITYPTDHKISNQFVIVGDTYKITYLEEQPFYLPVDKGLRRIEYLLDRPKQPAPAIILMQLDSQEVIKVQPLENIEEFRASGINEDTIFSDNDVVIPPEQIQQYKKQLKYLEEAIEEAKEFGEIEKVEKLKQDHDFFLAEIKNNTNHMGRPRTFNNEGRTVLNSLRKCLNRSYKDIKAYSPALYEHLKNSIKIAHQTVYHPLDECIWNEDKFCRQ